MRRLARRGLQQDPGSESARRRFRFPGSSLPVRLKRAGMRMNQTLTLQPGGRVLLNRARVTLMGVTVARIDEAIVKID